MIGLTEQMKKAARHKASLPKILDFIYRLYAPRSYRRFQNGKEAYPTLGRRMDEDGRDDGR